MYIYFLKRKKYTLMIFSVFFIGLLILQNLVMLVKDASKSDYNAESFWYYSGGKCVTHKGVDIFTKEGTLFNSSTKGLVLYSGEIGREGNLFWF